MNDFQDQNRSGDELTRAFRPIYDHGTSTIRFGEALAQAFVDLRNDVWVDDELLPFFIQADNALSALLTELWKRHNAS